MADTNNRPGSISSASASAASGEQQGQTIQAAVEPLYQVKLLQALRSGDPAAIHPFLAEITKDKRKSVDGDLDTGAAALHLAIRCGSVQTVALLLSHRAISPNGVHPPGSGTTPLHLAASLGRLDVVNLLLEQEDIDDSLRDAQGRTCRDVARGREIVRAIDDSRALLNATYRSLLHTYIHSPFSASSPAPTPPPPQLITLLSSPRAKFIDLSYLDAETGSSLLHEAARRKDLRLIELGVRAGADVFVRDRRGKMAGEGGGGGRDERVRVFLRQFANYDKTLIPNPTPLTEPPVLRGYLNKYTNVAKGYNTRWFVLKNGVLSYYKHQDDETIASRGSISMKNAVLHLSDRDKTKLEVHSSPAPSRSQGGNGASGPPSATAGVQKWYMKANHPVEAHRWAEAIRNSIEWFRIKEANAQGSATESDTSSLDRRRRRSGESVESVKAPVGTVGLTPPLGSAGGGQLPVPPALGSAAPTGGRTSASMWRKTLSRADRKREKERDRDSLGSSSYAFVGSSSGSVDASPQIAQGRPSQSYSVYAESHSQAHSQSHLSGGALAGDEGYDEEEDEDDEDEEESSGASVDFLLGGAGAGAGKRQHGPPHPDFELQGNATSAQLELSIQLLANLMSSLPSQPSSPPNLTETLTALKDSLHTTTSLLSSYTNSVLSRDKWRERHLRKERKRQRAWEESLAVVVREGEDLERELRERSRRRGSRLFGPSATSSRFIQPQTQTQQVPIVEVQEPVTPGLPPPSGAPPPPTIAQQQTQAPSAGPAGPPAPVPPKRSGTVDTLATLVTPAPNGQDTIRARPPGLPLPAQAPPQPPRGKPQDEDEDEEDEEDEFFDAIESNNLPNLVVYEHLKSPSTAGVPSTGALSPAKSPISLIEEIEQGDVDEVERELQTHPGGLIGLTVFSALSSPASPSSPLKLTFSIKLPPTISIPPFEGYTHLRSRLSITNDQRPSTSLWSVLKHSIGKDLTKISFPVFFNEPTSMLQRMAEDMEFVECLDIASHERDPLRRIAFVAAFAMSNYSSTIGRIAKPFNPMLSETFEYVRLDKQYRYVSEQVSHHPPISACWAESTSWHYYGEVDAQNKFMGKSFEIRPTGVAHADLLLPEDMAPNYPKAKGEASKGKVVEHYSWKKVTTSVSGFILGSPTIDHYGDMVVTNHRTGDQCILTFKPRGWRGKDAYEISGQVIDAEGNVAYEIAGRWNSQLVAKKVGAGKGQLHPDMSVSGPNSPSVSPEYILLWRNSEKPPGSPFNLTPFAITLNDCPQDTLRPFLCPTDCRLRPDQRAFELGKYELANDLKTQQEEKQRSIRKAREEGRMEPHRPRWFSAETDGDTGERVWSPVRTEEGRLEYWVERERVWREGGGKRWTGVDDIFIEEPGVVKELLGSTNTK